MKYRHRAVNFYLLYEKLTRTCMALRNIAEILLPSQIFIEKLDCGVQCTKAHTYSITREIRTRFAGDTTTCPLNSYIFGRTDGRWSWSFFSFAGILARSRRGFSVASDTVIDAATMGDERRRVTSQASFNEKTQ